MSAAQNENDGISERLVAGRRRVDGGRFMLIVTEHQGKQYGAIARHDPSDLGPANGLVLVSTPEGWHEATQVGGSTPRLVAEMIHRDLLRKHVGGA